MKKQTKGFILGFTSCALIFALALIVFAAPIYKTVEIVYNSIKINVDGKEVSYDDASKTVFLKPKSQEVSTPQTPSNGSFLLRSNAFSVIFAISLYFFPLIFVIIALILSAINRILSLLSFLFSSIIAYFFLFSLSS